MSVKAVLFDLDGTLLPMDQDVFVKAYFKGIAKRLSKIGYDPEKLIGAIWQGTGAMIKNDGSKTNEEAFWECFSDIYGEDKREDEPYFEDFYRSDFQKVKDVCGFNENSKKIIDMLKENGIRCILATNPIFPGIATESRIRWAGLSPDDFELYTTYENIGYCKPNPEYYKEILRRIELDAEECVMIGNDVSDDMVAQSLGMKTFLLTDDLINKENADIAIYSHGGFIELHTFLKGLL